MKQFKIPSNFSTTINTIQWPINAPVPGAPRPNRYRARRHDIQNQNVIRRLVFDDNTANNVRQLLR